MTFINEYGVRKWFLKSGMVLLLGFLVLYIGLEPATGQDYYNKDNALLVELLDQKSDTDENLMSIQFSNISLNEALEILAAKINVGFSYNPETIPNKKVNFELENVTSYEVIYKLLEGTNLKPILPPTKDVIIISKKEREEDVQTGVFTGRVLDTNTGDPIPGANIIVMGRNMGTSTNVDGEFTISNIPVGLHTIEVRFIGYRTIERQINIEEGETLTLEFELSQMAVGMDELVVTGTAGDTRRRAVGNAITSVDARLIMENTSRSNISEMLQSQTPGLTLLPGSGTAGTASNIRLRGAGSLTARTQPIVYIDGVRMNTGSQGNFDVFGQSTSALDAINPNDIQSIEVIKGPAASTLYGAEAAAGVIQIITKSGSMGERTLQWNYRSEIGRTDWAESLRPTNYSVCTQERISDSQLWPGCSGINPGEIISEVPLSENPNALRTGMMQSQNLSVQGGGREYSFFLSGNYGTEEGVYNNNFSDRGSLRGNFRYRPYENFDFTVNLGYSRNNIGLPLGDNTADGIIISSWLAQPGRFYPATGTTGYFTISPEDFNTYDNQTRTDRYILGTTVNYRPFEWFENRLRVGFDLSNGNAEVFFPPNNPFAARTSFGLANDNGLIAKASPRNQDMTIDYNGSIRFSVSEDVVSNFSFGLQYLATSFSRTSAIGQDLGAAALRSLSSAAVTTSNESFTEQKSLGFFAQEQIAYRDRLFFTAALRMDNNSAFGSEIQSVFYPKFSISHVISEENFFNIDLFDELRLRAAWGQAGNSPGPFDAIQTYGATATTLPDGSSVSALQYVSFGNPDLKPERSSEIEFGVDASMLANRLEVEATYYNTRTNDALVNVPIAPSVGFSGSQLQNLGTISNQGIEVLLRIVPILSDRIQLENTLSLTTNRNELVSLGQDRDSIVFGVYAPVHRFEEGKPLGAFWARAVARDQNGNVIFTDTGAPQLETTDRYKGPSVPTREVSFSSTLTAFGNLQFYVLFDYQGGHYQFNVKDWRRDRSGVSWETINPEADPSEVAARRFAGQTDIHVQPADFIKLRDLSVKYDLPDRWIQTLNLTRASVTVSGRNLAVLWTRYGGADPEVNFHGDATFDRNDSWTLPMTRRIAASLNLQF